MLNLDATAHPHWAVSTRVPLTLHPSVDEHTALGHCHYLITRGRLRWVERTEHTE